MKGSGLLPLNGRRDKDEESLVLFKELHKREKDRLATLLQPISDEFDPKGGSSALYRIASGKQGSGYEFLGENSKNDYDWLKTPPATPLFPSLELEATSAPELVVQREIPILQPLSRFASNTEPLKGSTPTQTPTPKSKPKMVPRSTTPVHGQRPRIFENKNPQTIQKITGLSANPSKQPQKIITSAKVTTQKETQSNISVQDTKSKTSSRSHSRGVSPSVRSRVPAQILGISSDTPPNLRTDRATSATRGRHVPSNATLHQKPDSSPTIHQKPDPNPTIHQKSESIQRSRRQSCSPSVTRGRKEGEAILGTQTKKVQMGNNNNNNNNNGTQILGSRMVDRVLNARKFGAEERESKLKAQTTTSWNNGRIPGGFVRTIPKSSQDKAPKAISNC
ncbi:uncharacterized protein [Euphorbia lathyris]|uniref:uncharacterized protein n=1 Tax=Euphorbia lathyris TaxID=212925 RepID=UPI0033140BD8